VVFVSGDRNLCEQAKSMNASITTVAVSEGLGNATISLNPNLSVKLIKEKVKEAVEGDLSLCKVKLPDNFNVEIRYKEHFEAYKASFFPGAMQKDSHTVTFEHTDYYEVLRFLFFVL
jgi:D-amino peptidase